MLANIIRAVGALLFLSFVAANSLDTPNSRGHRGQIIRDVEATNETTPVHDSQHEGRSILRYRGTSPGQAVKPGTDLRILCAGDSITVGFLKDVVQFAGTEVTGKMFDGYFAAWSGRTIQFIADHIGPSLAQQPNIILLHAGTNDMSSNGAISTEGQDPKEAASRLGALIDQMIMGSPRAVILVAMIVNTCHQDQSNRTKEYQQLIPGVVKQRRDGGHHVLAVDFTDLSVETLQDCIHPTNAGYKLFGDYWYDFMLQIPKDWIEKPVGDAPIRNGGRRTTPAVSLFLILFMLAYFL
ncbi:hypothetical protein MCOR02_007729 [Pyricularia oryzae]|nr:hypothetical protein MCOR02_007729 [Pyricularia oryzae]KAI6284747.1 hypothetical protein MCOR26_001870 [Pyricularia oryzae]KAI6321760.1 hypothetical protein MCOR34_002529 [Pyricularia oryzae]KAI6337460.1 hypothetical protein MCOR28_008540 [Pyricularia oryzae]KAI6423070.1 hypothetical protein MCOR21_008350 [Pyricularia oryzae]